MKYIPGFTFYVNKPKLSGTVKNYFTPGTMYSIYNITLKDGEVKYIITDGTKTFELKFNNNSEAESMIEYLTTQ
jgi:hypothetical protein